MSTKREEGNKGKKTITRGIYALPLLAALPAIAVMVAIMVRFWPSVQKLLSILTKLAVRG